MTDSTTTADELSNATEATQEQLDRDPKEEAYRLNLVAGLRELADFLDLNPHLCPSHQQRVTLSQFIWPESVYQGDDETDEDFARRVGDAEEVVRERMARLSLMTDGRWEKDYAGATLDLAKHFVSDRVRFELTAPRESVCTKRVVGTKTVKQRDYSQVPEVEVEEEIVEWDCHPILRATDRG